MAYAAGLGESDPRYYDTEAATGPLAHPLFPVCYEWPVSQPLRRIPALEPLFPRLVHAAHDLTLHRLPKAGDRLRVEASILAVAARKPGALVAFRFEARDTSDAPVSTSIFHALYRGVTVEGPDRGTIGKIPEAPAALQPVAKIEIPANLAHVYTECARIWNPIHTDIAYARRAGLPGLILHGTATLALSVSRLLSAWGLQPPLVSRVQCRFTGMVLMPSVLEIFASRSENRIFFETRKVDGEAVIRLGFMETR